MPRASSAAQAGGFPSRSRSVAAKAGFTLIELLIVLAIVMVLAGLATGTIFALQRKARERAVKIDIQTFTMALAVYHRELGGYPTDDITLLGGTADPVRGLNEALVYHLSRKLKGGDYGPYMEFQKERLDDKDNDGFDEYYDPFGNLYEYAENESDPMRPGRNKGSYDLVSPGRDELLGGIITAADGYVEATEANRTYERDNLSNWSK